MAEVGRGMHQAQQIGSILDGLRTGSDRAAESVFRRFSHRLIALAGSRLDEALQAKVDPEDVIQSVFRSFFDRYAKGQFEPEDWGEIWTILTVITIRKCRNKQLHFRMKRRDVGRECRPVTEATDVLAAVSREPTPEQAAVLTETLEGVMANLSHVQRVILSLHLQGLSVGEIGQSINRTERTVRRILQHVRDELEQR